MEAADVKKEIELVKSLNKEDFILYYKEKFAEKVLSIVNNILPFISFNNSLWYIVNRRKKLLKKYISTIIKRLPEINESENS